MKNKFALRVKCINCGWIGKRIAKECECEYEMIQTCSCVWGICPKCKYKVFTTNRIRRDKIQQKQVEEFRKTHSWIDGVGIIETKKD